MKPSLPPLATLLPLASRAQTPPQLPLLGYTYLAKMGNACAETNTGGCWKIFYYHLRFDRDSVVVTWIVQSVCRCQAPATSNDTAQTQRYA